MTSPDSDIMEGLTLYGGIVLASLVVLGTIYEAVKYFRGMFSRDLTMKLQCFTSDLHNKDTKTVALRIGYCLF